MENILPASYDIIYTLIINKPSFYFLFMNEVVRKGSKFFKTLYVDELIESDKNRFFSYSSVDYGEDNPYWNHLTCFPQDNKIETDIIKEAEKFFNKKNKNPCLYAVSEKEMSAPDDYITYFTDSWMFKPDKELRKETEIDLELVTNSVQLERFVELMYKTHSDELDDVYSGLSKEYGKQLKRKYDSNFEFCETNFYILKKYGENIGHRLIVDDGRDAMLTTLGILPEFRGKGNGRDAFYESLNLLDDRDNIFLQTEAGTENEELFDNLGFNTEFKGYGFLKKSS